MEMEFPKSAFYGSQLYNGFIFEDPYTKQGIEKITTIMQEILACNKTV